MADPVTYTKLEWDKVDERFYENGVDRAVLFPMGDNGTYGAGVAWSGITNITENNSGGEANDFYADNILYASVRTAEKPEGTIEAYMYPDEFAECDGSKELVAGSGVMARGQTRRSFGLAYRSFIGNGSDNFGADLSHPEGHYIIHLLYGLSVTPTEKSHDTINEDLDIEPMSWDYSGVPMPFTKRSGFKPVGSIEIDTRKVDATKVAKIEKAIYGETTDSTANPAVDGSASYLPTPDEIYTLLAA